MAVKKKRVSPKVTKAVVEGGTVTVGMGVRLSANFNSLNFDIGATLPLKPGEAPEKGLERVKSLVHGFFTGQAGEEVAYLQQFTDDIKKGKRT